MQRKSTQALIVLLVLAGCTDSKTPVAGPPTPSPKELPQTAAPHTGVDLPQIERTLFELSAAEIRRFTAEHPDVTIYGVFLDCAPWNGDVLLHMNSPEKLRQRVEQAKADHPEQYGNTSPEDLENEWRWEAGDWEYFEINGPSFSKQWRPLGEKIGQAIQDKSLEAEAFMQMVARVALKLESADETKGLRRTADFAVWCADQDEPLTDAKRRLEKLRKSASR